MRLVYGVGINDKTITTRHNGKAKLEYRLWKGVLERCYSEKLHKVRNTYIGCEASDNFKHYVYFHEWCQDQIGFGVKGNHIDKDLLIKGNKIYSEDTCVFIPKEINAMLTKTDASRGNLPIGVNFYKAGGKYRSQHVCGKVATHIGYYDSPIDAFMAYKREREIYFKHMADKYRNQIDPRAYDALMNYQVEITD